MATQKTALRGKKATCPAGQVIPIVIGRTNRFAAEVVLNLECANRNLAVAA